MSKQKTFYRIADINISVDFDFSYEMPDGNAADFLAETEDADFSYSFHKTDNIQKFLEDSHYISDLMMYHLFENSSGAKFAAFVYEEKYYDAVTIYQWESSHADIYYLHEGILAERCQKGFNFINYCCLEWMFPQFDALVLHSSHIDLGGKALLFSAPSQTGKSTQADLWKKENLAEVINGDRTVIRRINGVWTACGCPMCGTSGIHINSNEPLYAIVMLSQGKNNQITRLEGKKAFMLVYQQITMPTQLTDLLERNLENLQKLLSEVPVWHYSCTKEPEAVYCLKKVVIKDEGTN